MFIAVRFEDYAGLGDLAPLFTHWQLALLTGWTLEYCAQMDWLTINRLFAFEEGKRRAAIK